MPKNNSREVYIVDGLRTIVANPYKSLRIYSAAQLGAILVKKLTKKNRLTKSSINQVIFGNTVSAGTGQNLARQAALMGGASEGVSAFTVNNVCGSGLQSVILGAQAIKVGESSIGICGGTESSSHCPYLIKRENIDNPHEYMDSLFYDGLFCQVTNKQMGDLIEDVAKKNKITRRNQDKYTVENHQKAVAAQVNNKFKNSIVPAYNVKKELIERDDRPRKNMTMKNLGLLPTAFKEGGTVTSGNASVPCDGAAAVLLASKQALRKYKLKPKAKIIASVSIATKPENTFETVPLAIKAILKKARLSLQDIDLFEVSEAFSAQILYSIKKGKIPPEKLNIWGGDIALGHPLGAAGARILVTLTHALKDQGLKRGLVCVSYGGGGALAMVIEAT